MFRQGSKEWKGRQEFFQRQETRPVCLGMLMMVVVNPFYMALAAAVMMVMVLATPQAADGQ